jgi:hypothetical protein
LTIRVLPGRPLPNEIFADGEMTAAFATALAMALGALEGAFPR